MLLCKLWILGVEQFLLLHGAQNTPAPNTIALSRNLPKIDHFFIPETALLFPISVSATVQSYSMELLGHTM